MRGLDYVISKALSVLGTREVSGACGALLLWCSLRHVGLILDTDRNKASRLVTGRHSTPVGP